MAVSNVFSNSDPAWESGEGFLSCVPLRALGMGFVMSTRASGDMRIGGGLAGDRRRLDFAGRFAGSRPLVYARQVHKDHVVLLSDCRSAVYDESDGFFVPHTIHPVAGVFSADCLALCLYDVKSREYALVHSGWRGSHAGITKKALCMLTNRGADPSNIHAAFAPSILPCCYEVGREFLEYFSKDNFIEREGRLYFDNQGSARAACLDFGVSPEHIHTSSLCTVCDRELFFSHRRDGRSAGRMFTIAWRM